MAYVNKTVEKLEKIKELGLHIFDSNRSFAHDFRSPKADAYATKHIDGLNERGYVLGNVGASTESLRDAEYDVMFQAIENFSYRIVAKEYRNLHELALYTPEVLIEELGRYEAGTVYVDILDEINDRLSDIHDELDEIILELGGTLDTTKISLAFIKSESPYVSHLTRATNFILDNAENKDKLELKYSTVTSEAGDIFYVVHDRTIERIPNRILLDYLDLTREARLAKDLALENIEELKLPLPEGNKYLVNDLGIREIRLDVGEEESIFNTVDHPDITVHALWLD